MDGHASHLNLDFIQACLKSDKNVVVVLPAGQTARLQPLDRCFFGGFKKKWKDYLRFMRVSPQFETVSRKCKLFYFKLYSEKFWKIYVWIPCFLGHSKQLPLLISSMWRELPFSKLLQDGFRKTGIFPYNLDVIMSTVTKAARVETIAVPTYSPQKRFCWKHMKRSIILPNKSHEQ